MNRIISKVAVLGAGTMGSRIACLFANKAIEVLLLDVEAHELTREETLKGLNLTNKEVKYRIVDNALIEAITSDPAPLFLNELSTNIKTGTFEADFNKIVDCDWIIESVVENLEIKKRILEKVDLFRNKDSIVTTNTSGIPVNSLVEGRSEDFVKNFCGTHFFYPPRQNRLLEIIPTSKTDSRVIEFLKRFCDFHLGKNVIICNDTPGFIANRIGIFGILSVFQIMEKLDLSTDEIDKLTGSIAGRPKSATFRASDMVGLDTLIEVTENLYSFLPEEEHENFKLPGFIYELQQRNWLGDKTKHGFFKKDKSQKRRSEILTLDIKDFGYYPKKKVKFNTLNEARYIENLSDRLKILYNGRDKAGEFYRMSLMALFEYITHRIPEISDYIYKIDMALCSGFGWKLGPFEIWEALGVEIVLNDMLEVGYTPDTWIKNMISSGIKNFYKTENGIKKFYDINTARHVPVPDMEGIIILDNIRSEKLVWGNSGSSVIDLGDGILNIEFHTKMNTMGNEVIEGINKGIEIAEMDFRGVVIGNNGANFSAGANLGILFMLAIELDYEGIDFVIKTFQDTIMRVRYSGIPVVAAPHDLTLGGSCEMTLHADHVQAAAETQIGLVEAGVGLIPGGGGTKEMTRRASEQYEQGDIEFNILQNIFKNIVSAKVSTSAFEAYKLMYLRPGDKISINNQRLIADAKAAAIQIAEAGYAMPKPQEKIKVQGKSGMGMFFEDIQRLRTGNFISDHDVKIAGKLAWIMCGGDLSAPAEVSENYLLDLERESFLSLCGERKTLERIEAILQGKKPLRN